jgi:hypothetical protein
MADEPDKEQIEKLAAFAEARADEAMASALRWSERSGPQAAMRDLMEAGALYRARDVLREKL